MTNLFLTLLLVGPLAEWLAEHAVAIVGLLTSILIAVVSLFVGILGLGYRTMIGQNREMAKQGIQITKIETQVNRLVTDFDGHTSDETIHVTEREMRDLRDAFHSMETRVTSRVERLDESLDVRFNRVTERIDQVLAKIGQQ